MIATARMKKVILLMAIVLLVIVTCLGCKPAESGQGNGEVANDDEQKLVFKIGHPMSQTHPRHLASVKFAELVSERTNGRVDFEIYPAGQLGEEVELGEAVEMGTVDFAVIGGPIFTNWVPEYAVFGLPFLFNSYEQAYEVLDGPMGKKMEGLAEEKGFKIVSHWDHGFRQITNNVKPIEKPEDLKGIKMRVPEEFVNVETFKAFGCGVTPIPFGEVYLALQQKVVDGQENALGGIYDSKVYEVQKYLTISNHIYANSVLLTSTNTWDKIPEDIQDVMLQAADEAKVYMRELIQDSEDEIVAEIEAKGVEINYPDLAPFQDAAKEVYVNLEDRIGKEVIAEILK